MPTAADFYADDTPSAPLTVTPQAAPSPFPQLDGPLGAPAPVKKPITAADFYAANDDKTTPAKQLDAPGSTLAGSAVQGAVGLSEAPAAAAGMPGDIQSMGNSALDRFSNKAIHYLAKTYQENWQGKPWTAKDESDFKAYEDVSNPDTGILKPMATQALGPVGGAIVGASTLPTSEQTLGGADALRQSVGVNVPQPQGTAERYSRNIGMAVPLALDPAAGAAQMVKGAITQGAIPAVAATATADAIDDPTTKQVASFVAGGVAGHAPRALAQAGSMVTHAPTVAGVLNKVGITGPAYDNAGQAILSRAHDPQAVTDALLNPPNPRAPVGPEQFQKTPGVTPTTFEATKDLGIGEAQRGDMTNNSGAYADILAKNNEARQAHLNSIEPDGHADEVVAHLGKQFDALHDQSTQAIDAAKSNVPTEGAYQIEQGAPPEILGDAAQSHLGGLRSDVREAEGNLHKAVDPHGTLVSSVDPVDAAMKEAYGSLSPTGQRSMTPEEVQFRDIAEEYMKRSDEGTIPYREMGDFDSMVGAAIRNERSNNGNTPALRRMVLLQGGIKDSLKAVARQVAHTDAQGVKAGIMDPQNTLASRLTQTQQVDDAGNAGGVSASNRAGVRPSPAAAPEPAASPSPAGGASRGSDTPRPSDSDVAGRAPPASGAGAGQPQPVEPSIRFEADSEVQARQKAANAATIDRVTRFDEGPIGDVLAPGKRAGELKMPAANVPAKLFTKGPKGYTATKAYFDAAGNSPESVKVIHDIAIGALADGAAKNGGNLTKAIVDKWKMEHAHSLRAIDEVTPGFSGSYDERGSQFDNQQKALTEVERVTKEQNDRVAAHQKSVIGDILGSRDQGDGALSSRVRSMLRDQKNGVAKFQQLADAVEGNPDAKAGLRKVTADIMAEDLSKPEKQGTSDALATKAAGGYRKALEAAAPKLRRIMTPDEMANYYKVADTLDDANMSLKANLPQGGPGSAHDKTQAEKLNGGHGGGGHTGTAIVGALIGEQLLEHAAHFVPGYGLAAAGAAGTYAFLRRMGIRTGKELLSDALQHPDRAAIYVKAFTSNPNRSGRLNSILRKSFINQHKPEDGSDQGPNEPPPSGPFSPNGRDTQNNSKASLESAPPRQADERGRIEPTLAPVDRSGSNSDWVALQGRQPVNSPSNLGVKSDITPGNAPLTGRQARVLLADGHTPEAVRTMDHGARAAALQDAMSRGVEPVARIRPGDRESLGGAMPHPVHAGRSADGRFSEQPGGLEPASQAALIAETRLPSSDSLNTPSVPTSEQLKKFSRIEEIPLKQARSSQSKMDWEKFSKGDHPPVLIEGYGDLPVVGKKENGEYIVFDGHHRAVNEMSVGKEKMSAHVINVKDYDPQNAGRKSASSNENTDSLLRELLGGGPPKAAPVADPVFNLRSPERLAGAHDQAAHDAALGRDDPAARARTEAASEPAAEAQPDLTLRNPTTGAKTQAQAVASLKDAMRQFDVSGNKDVDMLTRASAMAIGDRLGKLVGDMKVYTVGPAEMRALAEGRMKMQAGFEPAGFFDPKSGHIAVLDDAMRDPREAASLLIHEGLHGAFMQTINKSEAARNVIDHLRQTALDAHYDRGGGPTGHYGLTNAHEFVSEGFSNPEFQRFLASIPADDRMVQAFGLDKAPGYSLWDVFVGAVRKILGMAPDQHTLLDATLRLGDLLQQRRAELSRAEKPAQTLRP